MKIPKQAYTREFKIKKLAVKRIKDGQSLAEKAKDQALIEQSLCNWARAVASRKLAGSGKGSETGRNGTLPLAGREPATQARTENHQKGDGLLGEGCAIRCT